MLNETGREYLEKNRILHISMLEAVRRGTAVIIAQSEKGVLLLDKASDVHMVSAVDMEHGKELLELVKDPYQMIVCQEELVEYAEEKFQLHDLFKCKKAVYFKMERPEMPYNLEMIRPDEEHLRMIIDYYDTIPVEEIIEINRRGNLFCAFNEGRFIGFCGCHLEEVWA